MKKKQNIESFGWYVLRTPLFPIEQIERAQKATTPEDFKKLFDNELFKEAVYLASHHLYERFERWLNGTIRWKKNPAKEEQKLIKSLLKYWLRASYRCTPFGTMAGVSNPAKFGEQTKIVLDDIGRYNRIDAEYLFLSTNKLVEARPHLIYYPNTHIYKSTTGKLRYFEHTLKQNEQDRFKYQYQFSEIEDQFYIQYLFSNFPRGASRKQLTESLLSQGLSNTDVLNFIQELINEQIIINGYKLSNVGEEYQEVILKHSELGTKLLNKIKDAKSVKEFLEMEELLVKIMQAKIPNIKKVVSNFFQVDSIRECQDNVLKLQIKRDVTKVVQALIQILPTHKNQYLKTFKVKFNDRYQTDFIPLNDVLDPENGIIYPQNYVLKEPFILRRLPFSTKLPNKTIELGFWDKFLLEIYTKALFKNSQVVRLSSKDLANDIQPSQLSETICAVISLISQDKIYLKSISSGGANLLGRFCHASEDISKKVRQINNFEQSINLDVIYAEIIHNPAHPKAYNILNRPKEIRDYKLLISTNPSCFDPSEIILLEDLLLGNVNDELILYSKKHGKRVIPKFTHAHNYRGSNYPVYQFLCDLALSKASPPNWHWGILEECMYLPRVEIDNIIVAPAKWRIKEISQLEELSVPQKCILVENDKKLLIDQQNDLSKQILTDKIKNSVNTKENSVVLEEYLYSDYVTKDRAGNHYTNEIIIPFKSQTIATTTFKPNILNSKKHLVGDKWLYLKIYCGFLTANHLLTNELYNLTKELEKKHLAKSWFFLRYNDLKGYHIRIRFNADFTIIERINKYLQKYLVKGHIHLVYDTYHTEEKRYGGKKTLVLCEDIFWIDSQTNLEVLRLLEQDDERFAIRIAMKNINYLMEVFGYSLQEKQTIAKQLSDHMYDEFNISKKQLANRYKEYLTLKHLNLKYDYLFQVRNDKMRPLVNQIKGYISKNICTKSLNDLFMSIAHMSLNRFFVEKQRAQEFITYDFLNLNYKSELAELVRQKK